MEEMEKKEPEKNCRICRKNECKKGHYKVMVVLFIYDDDIVKAMTTTRVFHKDNITFDKTQMPGKRSRKQFHRKDCKDGFYIIQDISCWHDSITIQTIMEEFEKWANHIVIKGHFAEYKKKPSLILENRSSAKRYINTMKKVDLLRYALIEDLYEI